MADDIPNLDVFIERDKRAVKVYLSFGALLVLLGVLIVISSFLPITESSDQVQDLLMTLGGGFISSLGGFPLSEYLKRRERIEAVGETKELWEQLSKSPNPPQEQLDRVKNLAWKVLETAAVG